MIKIVIMIAFILFVAVATVAQPTFFAQNSFLDPLVSHEILALLAVVLTITFASVANVHLALNQVIARVYRRDLAKGQNRARAVRDDINDNAWLLFWAFVFCLAVLLLKGQMGDNLFWRSALNGLALAVLILNGLVLYDIHRTVFALASSDLAVKGSREAPLPPADGPRAGDDNG
jgi:hypothetical protein